MKWLIAFGGWSLFDSYVGMVIDFRESQSEKAWLDIATREVGRSTRTRLKEAVHNMRN